MLDAQVGARIASFCNVSEVGFHSICFLGFVVSKPEASVVSVMGEAPFEASRERL